MEANLKKESPITYSNGKRLFTIDQKVDALVRIKMTGCSKAEVARSLHVAESTFRGWFKNKDIVMKAEAKYNELKHKSAAAASSSSDGYKSDDNRSDRSFSVESDDKNSSTCYTDDREGSRSRFSSPDTCAPAAPPVASSIRRSPDLHLNNSIGGINISSSSSNNNINTSTTTTTTPHNNNNTKTATNNNHHHHHHNQLGSSISSSTAAAAVAANNLLLGKHLNIGAGSALDLQHNTHLAAAAAAHHHISSLGLTGASAAAAVAAAAAAAAAAADHPGLRLSPADLHSKINSYFSPAALSASRPPVPDIFLTPPYALDNSYNKSSSSFINTMVTATLMEPQALDLSMHSRNKCKDSLSPSCTQSTQTSPKIVRHNFYRNLYKPYASRCLQEEKV